MRHLEDLKIDEFLSVLDKLSDYQPIEKLDGANLWFGLNNEGILFVSREGKRSNSERKFTPAEWPRISSFNQFRIAHCAILKMADTIKEILSPNQKIEIEVLIGKQPNTIEYKEDKNYIALLRGVEGTPESVVDSLFNTLRGKTISITTQIISSDDGEDIQNENQTLDVSFIEPNKGKQKKFNIKKLPELLSFLNQESEYSTYTNHELLNLSLAKVPAEDKEKVKQLRGDLDQKVLTDFKHPISIQLLKDYSSEVKSSIGNSLEGVVLKNGDDQIKLVDKNKFTAINEFYQQERNEIQGGIESFNKDDGLIKNGGLIGILRQDICDVLGNKELARTSNAREYFNSLTGTNEEKIESFISKYHLNDFEMVKQKILSLIEKTRNELKEKLDAFSGDISFELDTGETIKLTEPVVKRTKTIFAEAKYSLDLQEKEIEASRKMSELVGIIFKRIIGSNISESVLMEKKHKSGGLINRDDYNKSVEQLVMNYVLTVLTSICFLKEKNKLGIGRLSDKKNMKLLKWSSDMSVLNHLGYVIWGKNKDIKQQIGVVKDDLNKITKHFQHSMWENLHMELSSVGHKTIHFDKILTVVSRLVTYSKINNIRLYRIISSLEKGDGIEVYGKDLVVLCLENIPFVWSSIQLMSMLRKKGEKEMDLLKKIVEEDTPALTSTVDLAVGPDVKLGSVKMKRNPKLKKFSMLVKLKKVKT